MPGDTRYFACSGIFIDWDGKCRDNECQIILTSASLVRNPDYPYDDGDKTVEGLRVGAPSYFVLLVMMETRQLIISFADRSASSEQQTKRRDVNTLQFAI